MFLTRMGFDSKVVITGDITQVDLPGHKMSGLIEVQGVLKGIPVWRSRTFDEHDVVRHDSSRRLLPPTPNLKRNANAAGRKRRRTATASHHPPHDPRQERGERGGQQPSAPMEGQYPLAGRNRPTLSRSGR